MSNEPEGCWAVYNYDVGPYLISTWPSELLALRASNIDPGLTSRVVFLPWGVDLTDALKEDTA